MKDVSSAASQEHDMRQRAASLEDLVGSILDQAKHSGASAAEVSVGDNTGLSVTVRKGELETVEFHNDRGFGITVYVGKRKGTAHTSDASVGAVRDTVRAAVNIAKYTEEDPCNGLADAHLMATTLPDLDLYHPWAIDVPEATELATEAEAEALAFDQRIVNSEGAQVATKRSCHAYGNSHGFVKAVWATSHSTSCSMIAADDQGMQSDYWYTVGRDAADMEKPCRRRPRGGAPRGGAAEPRQIATGSYPVLFAPPMAAGLIGHLLSAISGAAQYRKESYLLDGIGRQVLASGISLAEHPHRRKGLAAPPSTAMAWPLAPKRSSRDGVLASYCAWHVLRSSSRSCHHRQPPAASFNLDVDAEQRADRRVDARDGYRPRGHEPDGPGGEPSDRRLFPRCDRILGGRWHSAASGGRNHHRCQPGRPLQGYRWLRRRCRCAPEAFARGRSWSRGCAWLLEPDRRCP